MFHGLGVIDRYPVADHERAREGPHIAHAVVKVESLQPGFFIDFAGYCLFQVLAGIHEPGDEGEAVFVPEPIIRQQHPFAVAAEDERHNRRFDAREYELAGCGAPHLAFPVDQRRISRVRGILHFKKVVAFSKGGGVAGTPGGVFVHGVEAEPVLRCGDGRIRVSSGEIFREREQFFILQVGCMVIGAFPVGGLSKFRFQAGFDDGVLWRFRQVMNGSVTVHKGFSTSRNNQVKILLHAHGFHSTACGLHSPAYAA